MIVLRDNVDEDVDMIILIILVCCLSRMTEVKFMHRFYKVVSAFFLLVTFMCSTGVSVEEQNCIFENRQSADCVGGGF